MMQPPGPAAHRAQVAVPIPASPPPDRGRARVERETIGVTSLVFSILYASFAVAHAFLLPPTVALVMVPVSSISAAGMGLVHLGIRRGRLPASLVRPASATLALAVLANSALLLVLLADVRQTTNFLLLEVALGFLFLSTPWFAATLALTVATWLAIAPPFGGLEPHWLFAQVSAATLAVVVQRVRAISFARVERLQAEHDEDVERFRTLAEAAFEGLVIHERGRFLEVNGAFCSITGYDRSELVGRHVSEFVAARDRPLVLDRVAHAKDDPYELEFVKKDGETVRLEVSGKNIPWRGRRVRVVAVHDVSDRHRAIENALRAERQAEEIRRLEAEHETQTTLLSTASHELNTPLTPLKVQLHILRQAGDLTPRQAKALDLLDRNVERLALLVEDLLDVARLENGKMRFEKRPTDLSAVVNEAVEAYRDAATLRRVAVDAKIAPQIPVTADARRLLQVLFNLLANALRFTPEGGRVTVEARREGDHALVRVTDTGRGLTPAEMSRLFRPFTQVHETPENRGNGTGLGLYISKGIVAEHGGDIWCESGGLGKGATFAFTIPLG